MSKNIFAYATYSDSKDNMEVANHTSALEVTVPNNDSSLSQQLPVSILLAEDPGPVPSTSIEQWLWHQFQETWRSCSLCGHVKVGPHCLASLLDLGQLSGARDEKENIKLTLDSNASGDRSTEHQTRTVTRRARGELLYFAPLFPSTQINIDIIF